LSDDYVKLEKKTKTKPRVTSGNAIRTVGSVLSKQLAVNWKTHGSSSERSAQKPDLAALIISSCSDVVQATVSSNGYDISCT